ncbi:MAG: MFS transporter [Candidatus Bathyarchaeia archaeon]|jgi:MFS family permease
MTNNAPPKQSLHERLGISPAFIVIMTTFIDMIGFGMVIPLLPFHPETAQAGAFALGILVGSFSLMQFIFSPLLGRISDKVGRRPILLFSIFVSVISYLIFAVADTYILLLISRIAAGMATEAGVAQAYIADTTTHEDRAGGMGKVGAAHGAGFIIGPALGGFLSIYGFEVAGLAAAILTAVNFVFAFFFLPESNAPIGPAAQTAVNSDSYWSRLVTAMTKPLMGTVFAILFITTFAFSAIPVLMPLLGIAFFGFTEIEMSYFFMYIGVVQIILQGFLIGRLTKKWGETNLIVLASLLMTLGIFCISLIPSVVVFIISLTMFSSGVGTLNTALPSFISKRSPQDEQGGMLGVAQSVGSLARVPGPLVAGLIAEFAGLNVAFFVSAAVVCVAFGLGFMVIRGNHHVNPVAVGLGVKNSDLPSGDAKN